MTHPVPHFVQQLFVHELEEAELCVGVEVVHRAAETEGLDPTHKYVDNWHIDDTIWNGKWNCA